MRKFRINFLIFIHFNLLRADQVIQKLVAYGFDVNDNEWLRRIIRDSLNKTIVELGFEIFDPKTGTYVLLE